MKHKMVIAIVIAAAVCVMATSQSPAKQNWVGIWRAHVDGLPTDTLALATDTGALGGTIVLDMVSQERGRPHVIASEAHVLLHPRVKGNMLSFQIKMTRPDGRTALRSFTVTRTSPENANIHCASCGPSTPEVELTRNPSAGLE